jgi:CRISPR-associated endonuclease Cas2
MKKKTKTKTDEREFTAAAKILLYFFAFSDMLPRPFEGKGHYTKRVFSGKADSAFLCYKVMRRLEDKGWLKVYKDPQDKRKNLYAITKEGRLEALFFKAQIPSQGSWDGKWRIALFDIPEDARAERNKLRSLLKANGYKQLQRSVFINPRPLNLDAIHYLKQTGLIKYIRIFRVDEPDDEASIKKMFGLK